MSGQNPEEKVSLWQLFQAFFQGFTTPSRDAFWAMIPGFVLMSAIVAWFFSYATLSSPTGAFLARSEKDSYGIASHHALKLGQQQDTRPLLVVMGSSVTSNAMGSDVALQEAVQKATGAEWQVALLATALQGPLEQIAMLETILSAPAAKERRIVAVLGVEPTVNFWNAQKVVELEEEVRMGLRSDWADAELVALGGTPKSRSGIYIVENWRFFLANGTRSIMRLASGRAAVPDYDFYAPPESLPANERKRDEIIEIMRTSHDPNSSGVLDSLSRLVDRLESYPNLQLVLLQEWPSPELIAQGELMDLLHSEADRYDAFAKENQVGFWRVFEENKVPAGAFYDDLHIGDRGAQDLLVKCVADKLAALESGG